jgi:hypothetical protein
MCPRRRRRGRAELRRVDVGRRRGSEAEVREGLREREQVVLHPSDTLSSASASPRTPSSAARDGMTGPLRARKPDPRPMTGFVLPDVAMPGPGSASRGVRERRVAGGPAPVLQREARTGLAEDAQNLGQRKVSRWFRGRGRTPCAAGPRSRRAGTGCWRSGCARRRSRGGPGCPLPGWPPPAGPPWGCRRPRGRGRWCSPDGTRAPR